MSTDIPVWVSGLQKWVTGVNKRTTCEDIVKALLRADGKGHHHSTTSCGRDSHRHYALVEKWRKMERPLDDRARILKVWRTWDEEASNVKFILKKLQPITPKEVKTLRRRPSSSVASDSSSSRHPSTTWKGRNAQRGARDTLHPRRLLEEDSRITDTMERLMKVIVAQGETIQAQLKRLHDKEEQIDFFEQKMHQMRMEEAGVNYLLDAYLGNRDERVGPGPVTANATEDCEAAGEVDDGVVGKCRADVSPPRIDPGEIVECVRVYEQVLEVLQRIEHEEDRILKLTAARQEIEAVQSNGTTESESGDEQVEVARTEVERMTAINAALALEIAQNERLLHETRALFLDKRHYVVLLSSDVQALELESQRLRGEFEGVLVLGNPQGTASCSLSSSSSADDSGYQADSPNLESATNNNSKDCSVDTDSNSDTGLSSLHSSSDDGAYALDTLV